MPPISAPSAFIIFETPEILRIRWRNRDLYGWLGSAIACAVLAGFAPVVLVLFLTGGVWGGLLGLLLWLYVLYTVLSALLGGTSITLDAHGLHIVSGPFPWTRTQTLATGDIERFETRSRHPAVGSEKRQSYVVVRLKNGREVEIAGAFPRRAMAEYLCETFTARLARTG